MYYTLRRELHNENRKKKCSGGRREREREREREKERERERNSGVSCPFFVAYEYARVFTWAAAATADSTVTGVVKIGDL